MVKRFRLWLIVILALAAGVAYVQFSKTRHTASGTQIYEGSRDDVQQVVIERGDERVELRLDGDVWRLVGHDSLEVREAPIDNLFDRVLKVERTTLMTRNADRWNVYSVDDSAGTRLSVRNAGGAELAAFVFGQSRRDWSKNYVRLGSDKAVYLTNNNITYYLNATPDFWGRKPEPAAADTTGPDIDVGVDAPSESAPLSPVMIDAKRDTSGPLNLNLGAVADTAKTRE
ncbi:MAG: DUF4340 domain-containing protein [Gemmatimonadetes bacterium]|nr:DUF4340 domain-containing protein [Gemmatimonadota bacterium]